MLSGYALALPLGDPERPYFGGSLPDQGVVLRRDPNRVFWPPRTISTTYNILALAIDPRNPATVYAGGSGLTKSAVLYRSDDFGVTWQWKDWGGPLIAANALAVDPRRTNVIYASGVEIDGVFRSDDRGEHWQPFSAGLSTAYQGANALVVDELGTPYAARDDGVYRWDADQGQWVPFGLQGRAVSSLAIEHGSPELLLAGTDMGVWKLELDRWSAWLPIVGR